MKYRSWFGGIILGFVIGSCVGFTQSYFFERPQYIASVTLSERLFFDEYWEAAPDVLVKAELRRVALSNRSPDATSHYEAILGDLLNEWFRLLDETLFRFSIDEALQSNAPGEEVQRYARLNSGISDGLNQRSISFRAVGATAEIVENELRDWVASVRAKSEELAHEAVTSWLKRKSASLTTLSESGGFGLSDDELLGVGDMAASFRHSANKLPVISPFQDQLSPIEVVSHPRQWTTRVAIWGLIGGLLSIFIIAGIRAKSDH